MARMRICRCRIFPKFAVGMMDCARYRRGKRPWNWQGVPCAAQPDSQKFLLLFFKKKRFLASFHSRYGWRLAIKDIETFARGIYDPYYAGSVRSCRS